MPQFMSYDRVNPKNVLLLKANGFVSISMSNKKYYGDCPIHSGRLKVGGGQRLDDNVSSGV